MIYYISKAFWLAVAPTNALILITAAAAFWALIRRSKRAARLALMSACGLAIGGFTPVGLGQWRRLKILPEWEPGSHAAPNGMILLGGDAGNGIIILAELSQQYPKARLVYSGPGRPIARINDALQKFADFGGDPTRISIETRSRTTFENAIYSAELMKPKPDERWLLITSALHMPRSVGSFRHAGFRVEPFPSSSSLKITQTHLLRTMRVRKRCANLTPRQKSGSASWRTESWAEPIHHFQGLSHRSCLGGPTSSE